MERCYSWSCRKEKLPKGISSGLVNKGSGERTTASNNNFPANSIGNMYNGLMHQYKQRWEAIRDITSALIGVSLLIAEHEAEISAL